MAELNTIATQGYKQFTIQGLECISIKGECLLCSLNKLGISKDNDDDDQNKCYQPQSNAVLIAKGIRYKTVPRSQKKGTH